MKRAIHIKGCIESFEKQVFMRDAEKPFLKLFTNVN